MKNIPIICLARSIFSIVMKFSSLVMHFSFRRDA